MVYLFEEEKFASRQNEHWSWMRLLAPLHDGLGKILLRRKPVLLLISSSLRSTEVLSCRYLEFLPLCSGFWSHCLDSHCWVGRSTSEPQDLFEVVLVSPGICSDLKAALLVEGSFVLKWRGGVCFFSAWEYFCFISKCLCHHRVYVWMSLKPFLCCDYLILHR